jgi:hypothetical protein
MWEKIRTLEADLASLRDAFLTSNQPTAALPSAVPSALIGSQNRKVRIEPAVAAVFTPVVVIVFLELLTSFSRTIIRTEPTSTVAALLAVSFLGGIVALNLVDGTIEGFYLREERISTCLLYSLLNLPIVILGAFILNIINQHRFRTERFHDPAILVVPLFQMMLFVSSVPSSRWLFRRQRPPEKPDVLPFAIALARFGISRDENEFLGVWKHGQKSLQF